MDLELRLHAVASRRDLQRELLAVDQVALVAVVSVEGKFDRIERKGATASTYSWEVTDKDGIRYVYGTGGGRLSLGECR